MSKKQERSGRPGRAETRVQSGLNSYWEGVSLIVEDVSDDYTHQTIIGLSLGEVVLRSRDRQGWRAVVASIGGATIEHGIAED